MTREELQRRTENIIERSSRTIDGMRTITKESNRVADVAHNAKKILEDLDEEFESQTGLNKTDVAFMFFATALQCVRWAVLTKFTDRVDHNKTDKGPYDEHSDRSHRWYNPSLEEIITNPVPFDTTQGSPDMGAGIGGPEHRLKTLGHDPILGWIFGTANIATSTLTAWNFQSYHIKTGENKCGNKIDKLTNHAKTDLVLSYTKDKLFNNGAKGRSIIGTSIIKEYYHLKSDIGSHKSLPFPIVSTISPKIADTLADYGIDMANVLTVAKQVAYAELINVIIGMIHYLFYDPIRDGSRRLYEVRTRKVITYSNLISSASNVLRVAIESYLGNQAALKKLDVGGFLVTIYRLLNDAKFIREVKEEFVFNNFDKLIRGRESV
ncbi:hypothetical protein [Sporomusa sp.]|uniref:hypothetical protein n=1 Tax=Sporomusa sp. TaxID=2078658 RepID=UPI002BDE5F9C|nr:hypothetical protein [Sporomusa sp.]HWR08948.1 hypothetical protein [Sporomusa sp.]